MKKACIVLVLLGVLLSIAGCSTIRGVGRDVGRVGEAMEDATN